MLGFTLTKSPAGDYSWTPLAGPIRALEQARAQRDSSSPAPTDSKPSSSPPTLSKPCPPTLKLEDLFPPTPPPSLTKPEVQRAHVTAYRRLHAQIKQAGLYDPPDFFVGYGQDIARYTLLAVLFAYCLRRGVQEVVGGWKRMGWIWGSATSLGFLWQYVLSLSLLSGFPEGTERLTMTVAVLSYFLCSQLTFLAHDCGHTSVLGSGDYFQNRALGVGVANFVGGLSLGWWADVR